VAARQRFALHVRRVRSPFGKRFEALLDDAVRAPQSHERAGDLLPRSERRAVVFEVDRHTRAVVLADAVRGAGIGQAAQILRVGRRREWRKPRAARADGLLQIQVRVCANQRFRERRRPHEHEPVPVGAREIERGLFIHRERRRHVERDETRDGVRMIERHARGDASAPVVTDHRERCVAVAAHQFDQIERHAALRIVRVVGGALRLAAVAIAAQIGRDHRESFGQRGRDLVPDRVGLRMAVQEQKRGAASAFDGVDLDAVDVCRRIREAFEHGCLPRLHAV
jgi:hypothetical protein